MANPASITVTALTANAAASFPSAQTIDTDGTVPMDPGGKTDRLILLVENAAAAALTVTIKAGDNPPAIMAGQGDLAVSVAASGGGTAKRVIGPFESSRFVQDDGTVNVAFLAASSTPNCTVRAYRLPKI